MKQKIPRAVSARDFNVFLMRYDDIHAIDDKYKLLINNCQESIRIAANYSRENLGKPNDQLRDLKLEI